MSKKIDCPFALCNTSDSVKRVLAHIHSLHDSSHLPHDFIDSLHLQRCKFCHNWFFKLTQHQSRCPKRCIKSDETENECHVTQRSADVADATTNLGSSGFGSRGDDSPKDNCGSGVLESNEREEYTEKEAWSFIRDISVYHHPPNTVRVVSQKLKPLFQDCCDIAFKRILNDPSDESGWKLLFSPPYYGTPTYKRWPFSGWSSSIGFPDFLAISMGSTALRQEADSWSSQIQPRC